MVKPVADIQGQLRGKEPGETASRCQDEIESSGFFRDAAAQIRVKRSSGELHVRSQAMRAFEQILDLWCKPGAMSQLGPLKLDIHDFCADQELAAVPALADRIG